MRLQNNSRRILNAANVYFEKVKSAANVGKKGTQIKHNVCERVCLRFDILKELEK